MEPIRYLEDLDDIEELEEISIDITAITATSNHGFWVAIAPPNMSCTIVYTYESKEAFHKACRDAAEMHDRGSNTSCLSYALRSEMYGTPSGSARCLFGLRNRKETPASDFLDDD